MGALKWSKPQQWALMMSLEQNECAMQREKPSEFAALRSAAIATAHLLTAALPGPLTAEEAMVIQLASRSNSFVLKRPGDSISALCPDMLAMIEHSCEPNCTWVDANEVAVRADHVTEPVKVGVR